LWSEAIAIAAEWRFDSSNARELWTVTQQRIFYNCGSHFSHAV